MGYAARANKHGNIKAMKHNGQDISTFLTNALGEVTAMNNGQGTDITRSQFFWLCDCMTDARNHDWFCCVYNSLADNGVHVFPGTPKTGPFSLNKDSFGFILKHVGYTLDARGRAQ